LIVAHLGYIVLWYSKEFGIPRHKVQSREWNRVLLIGHSASPTATFDSFAQIHVLPR
jgi:hypothetical protein